jgi:putative copper export protein
MAFLVRSIHVGSVSFTLGGALLLLIVFAIHRSAPKSSTEVLIKLMEAYEYGFWAAMGLVVATGVGNLAHFGDGLPGINTDWGQRFSLKLVLVGVLLALSAVRVLALHLVSSTPPGHRAARCPALEGLHGATAVMVTGAMGLAVAMAHF